MKGLWQLWDLFSSSTNDVFKNYKSFISAFLALIFLTNIESLLPYLGIGEESSLSLFLTFATTLLVFVVVSQVVLIEKRKRGGSGELAFFVTTYLLYNLYYSFLFFIGLFFLLIPGFYILVYFSMAPLIAVLDDNVGVKYFQRSIELVKLNTSLVAWASVVNLLLESSALALSPIHDPKIKMAATFIFSIPDAFLTIISTVAFVKIYYYLCDLHAQGLVATNNSHPLASNQKTEVKVN